MPSTIPFAHSRQGESEDSWETLTDHAERVARTAAAFAAEFGAAEAARLAGLLHDIGKVSAEVQAYLRGEGPSRDHSTAGAIVADALFAAGADRLTARLVSFAIAGHHAGLADGADLERRLASADLPDYRRWTDLALPLPATVVPQLRAGSDASAGYRLAFLGRMIFSCLVDADFIETERFYTADTRPRGGHAALETLREKLDAELVRRFAGQAGAVNAHRAAILAHARAKAALAPGLFTMTVPTGGGKTLASLAFALDHAIAHGLKRVIFAIPYTSIIDQTADVYRGILGDDDVLEHSGTVDWDAREREVDDEGARDVLARLRRAAENWDVPVVVTTAVQFFESLHADRPSRCRKLHNLANSVIVLDEAQTLPVPLLRPCMAAIGELATTYGASVVLCTATQPALTRQAGFPADKGGLDIAADRELAPDPPALYRALRRVTVRQAGAMADVDLAARFAERDEMLCIVNSRKHAQALFARIGNLPGARHLTTLMCPAHRRAVLADVRAALRHQEPVRLVSTSLIEAGVDVDFAEVWRAENGLDSIAQAAGRANREGRRPDAPVYIFKAADQETPPMFRPQVAAMETAMRHHADDPLSPDAIRAYFNQLYWTKGVELLDTARLPGGAPYRIMRELDASWTPGNAPPAPPYSSVAQAFRMIDDDGRALIVPWRGGEDPERIDRLLGQLRGAPVPPRNLLRELQQYTVSLPEHLFKKLLADGLVEAVAPDQYPNRFWLVADIKGVASHQQPYRPDIGLNVFDDRDEPMAITC